MSKRMLISTADRSKHFIPLAPAPAGLLDDPDGLSTFSGAAVSLAYDISGYVYAAVQYYSDSTAVATGTVEVASTPTGPWTAVTTGGTPTTTGTVVTLPPASWVRFQVSGYSSGDIRANLMP